MMNDAMTTNEQNDLQELLPAWCALVLAPTPAIFISQDGSAGLVYFFVACAGFVAYSFVGEIDGEATGGEYPTRWHQRMLVTGGALVAAWLCFASFCALLPSRHQFVAASLGLLLLVPCLCIVPTMVLMTRRLFAAVVLSIALVACVKLAGCIVVVAVYGWRADELGHTDMPWTNPNLLVWCFLIGTAALSAASYFLGARRWQSAHTLSN